MSGLSTISLPPIYLITDRKLATPGLLVVLEAALKGGVRMIQLREKDLSLTELQQLAVKVLKLTRIYDARLLLNGSVELATEIGADGVHLGVKSCGIATAKSIMGKQAIIGYSAHNIQEIEAAAVAGANFATFSPIYATPSKAQYGPPQGIQTLRDVCREAPLPVYALGGIDAERISEVVDAGASGVAFISAIMGATDAQKTARHLLQEISTSQHQLRDSD